jgi:hypothetical protein
MPDLAQDQARAHCLAEALDRVMERLASESGLSSAAVGAALTEAAVRWSLRDMAAVAVAEYLIATAMHAAAEPGARRLIRKARRARRHIISPG